MDLFREFMCAPWFEWPIVVLDFETTGPDPNTCEPVEVALVRFEGGDVVTRWSSLVKPSCPIPAEATAIHGITDADVADAPTLLEALDTSPVGLLEDGVIPCAYSAQFDRTILHRLMPGARAGHRFTHLDTNMLWLDPLVIVRHVDRFVPGKGRHRLGTTCARHKVPHAEQHRALGDAEATGRLLFSSAISGALGDMTIGEVLRRQRTRAEQQECDRQAWLAKQPPLDGAAP